MKMINHNSKGFSFSSHRVNCKIKFKKVDKDNELLFKCKPPKFPIVSYGWILSLHTKHLIAWCSFICQATVTVLTTYQR